MTNNGFVDDISHVVDVSKKVKSMTKIRINDTEKMSDMDKGNRTNCSVDAQHQRTFA